MSIRLATAILTASACAAPMAKSAAPTLPTATVPPHMCPTESPPPDQVSSRCRETADRLARLLADDTSVVCAEDNSGNGPRAAELRGACDDANSADRAVENRIRQKLDDARRFCFGQEQAHRLRETTEQPSDEVTDTCQRTLRWIDEVLGDAKSRCENNNGPDGQRWQELADNCPHWSFGKTVGSFFVPSVRQRAEALKEAHASCKQTGASYRQRYGDRGSN